ncbi:heat shock protein beta-1-like [Oncorhynchus keta]|uniref:heat shock protein beta-1-like n=1 Tax=Oncorhynchus keta TaxID=8018 RepID=UPI0015FD4B7B|nr:heat shock protein beta-1-like [Oncorhynchus keta]
MADHNKVLPRPLFRRDVNWDPFREWTQPSHMIMEKDFGLPPFLDPGDVSWIDWARNTLASSSWPGYKHYPLFSPSTVLPAAVAPQTSARLQRQLSGGVSAIRTEHGSWRITLDVNHFSPEEISIKTKGGFLEIAGQHDEREDEHGSVSRCFIRKNKHLQHISSSLSGEGVLLVEAPLPGSATTILPSDMVLPIQLKNEQEGKE